MTLKAIIVDDEEYSRKSLFFLLEVNCPNVVVSRIAKSVAEAREFLKDEYFDLVFLDIAMPKENGFALLEDLDKNETAVVFTTAYDQYAIKAIKASALDYLLKPISIDDLKFAVTKAAFWKEYKMSEALAGRKLSGNFSSLCENMNEEQEIRKISLPNANGFHVVDINQIVYIEADNNYSNFYLHQSPPILISKPLTYYEEILNTDNFCRIHKSIIINLNYLKDYSNKNGCFVRLHNQKELPVSRRRSTNFIDRAKLFFQQ